MAEISLNIPLRVENVPNAKWPRRIKARPRIQRAFDSWYRANQKNFLVQLNFIRRCDNSIWFGFAGINQIINAAVSLNDLSVYVTWQGDCWDLLISLDTSPERVPGGYVCTMCDPETRKTLPSREAVWETDLFEPMLQWVNERLAPATALHLFGGDGFTAAKLIVESE